MASFARFSLPVLLPSLAFKRFLSPPATVFYEGLPKPLFVAESRHPSFFCRSMSADANREEIVPRSVPVRVAHELFQAGHRYLDVRTVDEFIVGHPVGATNIPYMFKVGSGMTKNPNFLKEVTSIFRKDDEIIIGCLSGRRSLMAAADLSSAGFTAVTDIAGGYSAWVQNGLPTQQ